MRPAHARYYALLALACGAAVLFAPMPFAAIGGLILAGAIVGIVQALVAAYVDPAIGGSASSIVPFVFMLLILLVRPTGLFGWRHVERV